MSKCMVTAYDDVKIRESNGLYILMELIPLIGFHFRILICFSLMNDENVKFKIKIMMHVKLNKMDTAKIQIHVCLYSPLEEEPLYTYIQTICDLWIFKKNHSKK